MKIDRRTVLQLGIIPALGLTENLFAGEKSSNKAVIWIWLAGGASHSDLFSPPARTAPSEYASVHGNIQTAIPGVEFGGLLKNLAAQAKDLSIVRSYGHTNADHNLATHLVMTGYNKTGTNQSRPAIGSVIANSLGSFNKDSGLPLYVKSGNIEYDRAIYLGSQNDPFDINSDAKKNFLPTQEARRLNERLHVLSSLDKFQMDSRFVKDQNEIKSMAYNLIFGKAREAFDLSKEPEKVREGYGKGFGENLLLARRLIQAGSRIVNISNSNWDFHTNIFSSLQNLVPPTDQGIAFLLKDLKINGMLDDTLVVITSEFGRTPKLNAGNSSANNSTNSASSAGRDHYGRLGNLVFAGGNYSHGRTIGEIDSKSTESKTELFGPQDILHTILHHFGITNGYIKDFSGRPIKIVEKGKLILT